MSGRWFDGGIFFVVLRAINTYRKLVTRFTGADAKIVFESDDVIMHQKYVNIAAALIKKGDIFVT